MSQSYLVIPRKSSPEGGRDLDLFSGPLHVVSFAEGVDGAYRGVDELDWAVEVVLVPGSRRGGEEDLDEGGRPEDRVRLRRGDLPRRPGLRPEVLHAGVDAEGGGHPGPVVDEHLTEVEGDPLDREAGVEVEVEGHRWAFQAAEKTEIESPSIRKRTGR